MLTNLALNITEPHKIVARFAKKCGIYAHMYIVVEVKENPPTFFSAQIGDVENGKYDVLGPISFSTREAAVENMMLRGAEKPTEIYRIPDCEHLDGHADNYAAPVEYEMLFTNHRIFRSLNSEMEFNHA